MSNKAFGAELKSKLAELAFIDKCQSHIVSVHKTIGWKARAQPVDLNSQKSKPTTKWQSKANMAAVYFGRILNFNIYSPSSILTFVSLNSEREDVALEQQDLEKYRHAKW